MRLTPRGERALACLLVLLFVAACAAVGAVEASAPVIR